MTSQLPRINSMLKELSQGTLKQNYQSLLSISRFGRTKIISLSLWEIVNGERAEDQFIWMHNKKEREIVETLENLLKINRL